MRKLILLVLLMGAWTTAFAQGVRYDNVAYLDSGRPARNAEIRVCEDGATGTPCTPLADVFTDQALTVPITQPVEPDNQGNFFFYAASGEYCIQLSGPGITTRTMCDVSLGGAGGGSPGGSTTELQRKSGSSFAAVTGSSVSGANITLGGDLTLDSSDPDVSFGTQGDAEIKFTASAATVRAMTITGHASTSGTGSGDGGAINITGGAASSNGAATTNVGGAVNVTGGQGRDIFGGGPVNITGGPAGNTGDGGAVNLSGGVPASGGGGDINLTASAGVGSDKAGGNINIVPGAPTGTGQAGRFFFKDAVDPTKQMVLDLSSFTTSSIRTIKPPNSDATLAAIDFSQSFSQTQTFTGTLIADAATATRPIKAGTSAPGTCEANKDLFIDTDATPGQQLLLCNSGGNGFNLLGDGGGAGGDSITVATVAATDPDIIDTASSGTEAGVDFTLDTGATPDTIAGKVAAASGSVAGVVTTGAQTFAGLKTFTGNMEGTQASDTSTFFKVKRFTDTTPTGTYVDFRDTADTSSLFNVDMIGIATAQEFVSGSSGVGIVRMYDSDQSESAGFKSTATVSTSYVLEMPAAIASGFLSTNGSAVMTFSRVIDGATTGATRGADDAIIQLRRHATDCTALTDGKSGEACYEQDADTFYICEPTAGDCSGSEWKQVTGGGGGSPGGSGTEVQYRAGASTFGAVTGSTVSGSNVTFNGTLTAASDISAGVGGSSAGALVLTEASAGGTNTFTFTVPNITTAYSWTVPAADSLGFVRTDGAGVLSSVGETGSGNVARATNPTLADVTVDDLITFTESAGDATCAAGDYWQKGNSSSGKMRGCENGTLFDVNTSGGSAHAILSSTHSDSTAGTVARGDVITGQGASPTWQRLVKGTADQCLKMDGSAVDVTWGTCSGGGTDSITVATVAATDPDFIDFATSGTEAGVDFTLDTGATPDTISGKVAAASASLAGVVTTGTQTMAGAKTFSGNVITPILNATTGVQINGAAASGQILRGDGTQFVSGDDVITITYIAGGDNASAVLADADDQNAVWVNDKGRTYRITRVWSSADSATGSPAINLQRDDGTAASALSASLLPLTGNGACADSSGASMTIRGGSITCSNVIVSGERDFAVGDQLNFSLVTAGGTAKRITVQVRMVAQ